MITSIKQIEIHNQFTAKSLQNLATPKQWGLIERAAKTANVSAQAISREMFKVDYQTLTRANADKLIKHLATMPNVQKAVTFYSIETVSEIEAIAHELAIAECAAPIIEGEFVELTAKSVALKDSLTYEATIEAVGARSYNVISAHNGSVNLVEFQAANGKRLVRCSCSHHEYKRAICKHLLKAYPIHLTNRAIQSALFSGKAKF